MRCLIIDNDIILARYLGNGFKEAGYSVGVYAFGQEGIAKALAHQWDVLVINHASDHGSDCLPVLNALRSMGKAGLVVVLSSQHGAEDCVRLLQNGADDYVRKPFAFSELFARVQRLLRRSLPAMDQDISRIADLEVSLRRRTVYRSGRAILLQPRSFSLLECLLRHREEVVTRTTLLKMTWGEDAAVLNGTVDTHISRLRARIDGGHALPLVHTVRGLGYMLSSTPPLTA
jgi:two-component system OmpR family response regulator